MPISRKHFNSLAKVFAVGKQYATCEEELRHQAITVNAIADILATTSATFQKDRFLLAAGFPTAATLLKEIDNA